MKRPRRERGGIAQAFPAKLGAPPSSANQAMKPHVNDAGSSKRDNAAAVK
jgi:hypothetical protein